MKKIQDILKPNKKMIDAEKLFDKEGRLIEEYVDILEREKPIRPKILSHHKQKFFAIKENRDRYEQFPNRLPTYDYLPFPVDAHELIGEYESKHNLYLTIAHAYNKAMDEIDRLNARIAKLESRTKV